MLLERVTAPNEAARALVGELEEILSAAYPPENRHGLALERIFQPHIHFYLARVDGVPAGCGGVALLDGWAELKRMYVRPGHRGSGVAVGLLGRLAGVASQAGYGQLWLETGDAQAAALRFYAREGFRTCGAFGDYEAMPPEAVATSVFMVKELG